MMHPGLKIVSFLMVVLVACSNPDENNLLVQISGLEKSVEKSESPKDVLKLLDAYKTFLNDYDQSPSLRWKTLKKAWLLAKKTGNDSFTKQFATLSLLDFPRYKGRDEKVIELIRIYEKEGKKPVASVLKLAYVEAFPDGSKVDSVKNVLPVSFEKADSLLVSLGKNVLVRPGEQGINEMAARMYIDASEGYALCLPDKDNTPGFLMNAAQLTRSLGDLDRTFQLFDWISRKYPGDDDAPVALMTKGFILDNDMKKLEDAKVVYRQFIESYPDHAMTSQVQFLLDNLGKSNEDLLKKLEQQPK